MSASGVADPATFTAADAMQAAYFRAYLGQQHRHLLADLAKHEAELAKLTDPGHSLAIGRVRAQLRAVQAELRHVDKLVERLDGRFAETHVAAAPTAP
jgi:hypothetical protein